MALFKKKEESSCCCGGNCASGSVQEKGISKSLDGIKSVKILGSGCAKCNQLEAAAKEALKQLGINLQIEHVTDFGKIAAYGVMSTPALVVNERVVSYGKVLKVEEVVKNLQKI